MPRSKALLAYKNRTVADRRVRLNRSTPKVVLSGKSSRLSSTGSSRMKMYKGFSATQSASLERAIRGSQETKYWATDLVVYNAINNVLAVPCGAGATGDMYPLVPTIKAGTGEHERIGRFIQPKRCALDVTLAFSGAVDPNVAQVDVMMYIVRSKKYKCYQDILTAAAAAGFGPTHPLANFVDSGQGTSIPFGDWVTPGGTNTSTVLDTYRPVDTSNWGVVKVVRVKLTKNTGPTNGGTTAVAPLLDSSSWTGRVSFDLPKLEYDDSNPTAAGYPLNSPLAVGFTYVASNGYKLTAGVDPAAVVITARSHYWYTDA